MTSKTTQTKLSLRPRLNMYSSFVISYSDEAAGAADDWYKGFLKSRFVYTIELRDKEGSGYSGWLLPANQIKPSGEELWAAQRVVFQKMVDLSNDETTPTPQPPIGGCGSPEWAFDDWCDEENNNVGCNYDDGACCKNYAAGIPAGTGTV